MSSDQMKVELDWNKLTDEGSRKENRKKPGSIHKKKVAKPRTSSSTSSKSTGKIDSQFIKSIKFAHIPGELSIEIHYAVGDEIEEIHGKNTNLVNKEEIRGLKRILDIFE
ncbi:MAG: hypothetical protein ACTSWX_04985 [Promethearchaeota archaeon]